MMRKDDIKNEDKEYQVKQISKIIKNISVLEKKKIIGSDVSHDIIAALNDLSHFRKHSRLKQTSSFTQSNVNRLLASLERLKSVLADSDLNKYEKFLANNILAFSLTSLERRLNKFKKGHEADAVTFVRIENLREVSQQKNKDHLLEMEVDVQEPVNKNKEEMIEQADSREFNLNFEFFSNSSEFKRLQIMGSGNFANCYLFQVFGEAYQKLEPLGLCDRDGYIMVKEPRSGQFDPFEGEVGGALFAIAIQTGKILVNPVINIKFDNQPMMISRREANKDAISFLTQQRYKWEVQQKQPAVLAAQLMDCFQMTYAGMQFMHANGYLHLDIGLRNVLVNGDGKFLLADFGLAVPKNISSNDVFTETTTRGPIRWIDGRRANEKKASMASDLFSLKIAFMEAFAVAANHDVRDIFPYDLKELEEKRKAGLSDDTYLSETVQKLETLLGSEENLLVPIEIYAVYKKMELFLKSSFSFEDKISQGDLEAAMLHERITFDDAMHELEETEWYQHVQEIDFTQVVQHIVELTQSAEGFVDDYQQSNLPPDTRKALEKMSLFSTPANQEDRGPELIPEGSQPEIKPGSTQIK